MLSLEIASEYYKLRLDVMHFENRNIIPNLSYPNKILFGMACIFEMLSENLQTFTVARQARIDYLKSQGI